jgi:FixJ family two-component response regulator
VTSASPVVFVVDDDASFLTAIARLLRAGGYAFETYRSATEVLGRPPADQPGCMIVDLHMPGPSGLDLQEALAKAGNTLPLIFLTGHGDISTSVHAIKQGAEDFLTKPVKRDVLFAAIERALARDARAREERGRLRELLDRFEKLTPREHEVLTHVVRGRLNKQIAGDLDVAERTIKAHRASIMAKLEVQSVAELVRLAQEVGVRV